MEIIWLPMAEKALEAIFSFYEEKSIKAARKIIADILQATDQLSVHPEMATIEELLQERQETFRSLVVRQTYKVVYYIEDTVIYIADVWDCRQFPEKLKKGIRKPNHPQKNDTLKKHEDQ